MNAFNKNSLSTTALYNSAFGSNVLYKNSGNFNTCVGHASGYENTTGSCITGIGTRSLANNTDGNYNTAVGFQSSYQNTNGFCNTSIGDYSLQSNTIGNFNCAFGFAVAFS